MELRALQPISAPAPISREFTVNRYTIQRKEPSDLHWELGVDKERGKSGKRVDKHPGHWNSKGKAADRSCADETKKKKHSSPEEQEELLIYRKKQVGLRIVINTFGNKESYRKEEITDTLELVRGNGEDKSKGVQDLAKTIRDKEEDEGRPLAGGPHRCAAQRGQSAAA